MRSLSQVDPWNGCKVCRQQAELGYMPLHDWTHELRMWWNDKVPSWTRGTEPGQEGPVVPAPVVPATGPYWSSLGAGVASVLGKLPAAKKGGGRCQATR